MATENLINAAEFCNYHHIELSFVQALYEHGLVNVVVIDGDKFIEDDQLNEVEKLRRLHYDLEINIEGLEAISHLLGNIENLLGEITTLKNRLRVYE